ncbi:glucodextranase DOMON-like domain-containing protein [Halorubrum sp. DTA46]|uniref:glucodextranase DOMON-like domain-containing protein n=1 Tax=Halorubrum sp. DTA46 TaxID=3402162 RepID=UPI003AAF7CF2
MYDAHDDPQDGTDRPGGDRNAYAGKRTVRRRTVLGGLAGLGVLGAAGGAGEAGATTDGEPDPRRQTTDRTPTGTGSYHPGQPLFVSVGERLWNTAWVGPEYIGDRDNLAPGVPEPDADPENYAADDFAWRVVDAPADSDVALTYASSLFEDRPRYDEGRENVAEFEADVPGTYALQLDAPDGTHRLTIEALPDDEDGSAGPPRLELDGTHEHGRFEIDADARPAPDAAVSADDLRLHVLVDDRDALDAADVNVDGTTATVDDAVLGGESARVHAVVHDGRRRSVADVIELHPDGEVSLPNRAPEWIEEGVMYQIFTRSWAGERGATTFDTLIDGTVEGDGGDDSERSTNARAARGVDYLDELGIDVVWLTPIHPAVSAERTFPGGGPHGYDITDYFGVAEDLAPDGTEPLEAYEAFVDACHERDIRVCLDLVVNHGGRSMREFQDTIASRTDEPEYWPIVEAWDRDSKHFDWFDRIEAERTWDGRTLEPEPFVTGFWNLQLHPNFNFDNVALREYMLAVADFWSGVVGVDGFRCDIAWGVPHSFWKDVREVCRANDSEFLLLDEAIPNDPAFSESEFDMHFDTEGFTVPAHGVANGDTSPDELFDSVRARAEQGFPDYSLILNAIENHDEERTLNQALDGTRGDPRKAQRATWAAGVTLPGVPHVYYGQERAISAFGEGRHRGEDDPRDEGDVNPGGRQRAFMNWEAYDAEHLAFYRELIDAYHELDALKPRAALSGAWHNAVSGDLLVFGRDASALDDVAGPERVVVAINVDPGTAEVYLRPGVGGTDLISGDDVSFETPSNARAVEVDTVAVLEAPDLLEIGSPVAEFDADSNTDHGPGGYVYPTDDAYADGAFDLSAFSIHETPTDVQFRARIDGDLENPWDLPEGFSVQHLQVYMREDGGDGEDSDAGGPSSTEPRPGVNAALAEPHTHRLVVDGENGARVEDADGSVVTEGTVRVNEVTDAIIAEVPKGAFPIDLEGASVAPLLLGYAPDRPGNATPVDAEAGAHAFGGGRDDDANPNVIDLLVDATVDRDEALAYDADGPAEIGYVPLVTPYAEVAAFDAPTGEAPGPGTYETPLSDDYYEGAWDLDGLTVHQSRDRVRFEYHFAEPLQNPWGFDPGFSHQLPQIYVNDPATDDPETTAGRTGTNVAFEAPYNYRVNVNPETGSGIEDANGDAVSRDVEVDGDGDTITVSVPRRAIGWNAERGVAFAAVVCPFDGFGDGGLRTIEAEADEHVIGGGNDGDWDPRVMDMITPEGIDRAETLAAYDEESPAVLPYVTIGDLSRDDLETDETDGGDDRSGNDGTDDGDTADGDDGGVESTTDDSVPGLGVAAGAVGVGGAALAAKRLADETDTVDETDVTDDRP